MPPIDYTPPTGLSPKPAPRRYKLLIDEAVRLLGTQFEIAFVAQGIVYFSAPGGKQSSANLLPIIRDTAGLKDDGQVLDAVHRHVSTMLQATAARKAAPQKTYAQVKRKLAARIYPDDGTFGRGDFVSECHLPGTVTALMLDDEGAFASVSPEALQNWGISADEAFHVAIENASKHKMDVTKLRPDTPSGKFTIYLLGEDNHASSFALALPMFGRRYLGEHGALVAVPGRELVVCTRLDRDSPRDIVNACVATVGELVRASYQRSDRPVSQGFYWLNELGVFTEVKVHRADGRVWVEEVAGMWD